MMPLARAASTAVGRRRVCLTYSSRSLSAFAGAPLFAGAAAFSSPWYWYSMPRAWWQSEFTVLDRFVREHLDPLQLAAHGPWVPWARSEWDAAKVLAGVEIVALRAGADPSRFLLWVHDVRNGSKPCVSESSRRVESFQLSLGAPGGKSGWNVSWIETDSGNSFALPVDAHGVLSTRAFVGDGVLVGR